MAASNTNTTVPGEPCITGFGHCAYLPVSWGSADSLSMGSRHLCVIGPASSHQVRCWGDTTLARLSVDSTVPFAQISAGGAHTCARLSVPGDVSR